MLIGYMRVSKAANGSQVLDLQRDALIADGVKPSHLYQDQASGKKDDRPGLEACLKSLREGRHAGGLEARPSRARPPPPRQHHPRSDGAQDRLPRAHGARCQT